MVAAIGEAHFFNKERGCQGAFHRGRAAAYGFLTHNS